MRHNMGLLATLEVRFTSKDNGVFTLPNIIEIKNFLVGCKNTL